MIQSLPSLTATVLLAASTFCTSLLAQKEEPPTFVWWEAEDTASSTHAGVQHYKADSDFGAVASGRALLWPDRDSSGMMSATYDLEVPKSGSYHLWVRKFWKHGPFKWRFNGGQWNELGRDIVLHDSSFIKLHHSANWVYIGQVALDQGEQTFEIESLDNKGFLDAFLLIDGLFQPAGALKPGEKSGKAEEGYFAWEPGGDPFTDESAIDLRWINEEYAGANGYIRREGNRFVRGDGVEVRFWMTQADAVGQGMQPKMQEVHARRLAKYGVNLVRVSFMDMFKTWRQGDEEAFARQLDSLHHGVAALKAEGIYTYFGHLFWDTHVPSLSDDDLPGLKKGEKPIAAMFVNEPLQSYYLEFVRDLMTPVNPHTNLSLAEDPAVAIIEVQNESNSLFWTFNPNRLAPDTLERMQRRFGEFASEKHGSLKKAFDHWGQPLKGDDLNAGKAQVLPAYNMTQQGYSQHAKRSADQIEFLTELQYDTYAKMKAAFHEMGIRKMVAGSNWKTADPSTLGPLEHYSYTATDMVNRNEYFGPEKVQDLRGYAVDVGDVFKPVTAMYNPQSAGPLITNQQADWPYMITENNWDNPNPYRAEWPFLVATYGSMAGIDGWNFFVYNSAMWVSSLDVWDTSSPIILGQYPAYALMYRRGDVKTGPTAVLEQVSPESLYQNDPIALPEIQYKDFVAEQMVGDAQAEFESEIDPRAFFVGPVQLDMHSGEKALETVDLSTYIDDAGEQIRNTNGQLVWNYGLGFASVDTPTSQGASGFLGQAGPIRLSDVIIQSGNEYASIVAVAMDNRPLAESGKILIQAATQEKLYGYKTIDAGDGAKKITAMGGYPMNVEKIRATVILRGMAGREVTALDELGYPIDKSVETKTMGDRLVITLPEDSLYTLIR